MTTNERSGVRTNGRLVAGAVLTAVVAMALIWAGWRLTGIGHSWSDLTDPGHWLGATLRGAGVLMFGKTGLKIGLVIVGAVVGIVLWLRGRRRNH